MDGGRSEYSAKVAGLYFVNEGEHPKSFKISDLCLRKSAPVDSTV